MNKLPFTVIVDFDGTIVEEAYPKIGELLYGAQASLIALDALGAKIVISTCRAGIQEDEARRFLIDQGIPFDYFNENVAERIAYYNTDTRKMSGEVYVDDKNLGGFPGWPDAMREIMNMMKKY